METIEARAGVGGGWAKQTHASLNGTEKEREAQAAQIQRVAKAKGPRAIAAKK